MFARTVTSTWTDAAIPGTPWASASSAAETVPLTPSAPPTFSP